MLEFILTYETEIYAVLFVFGIALPIVLTNPQPLFPSERRSNDILAGVGAVAILFTIITIIINIIAGNPA